MVRNGISLKQAASEVGHSLDPDEAEKVARRSEFQEILRGEKRKYEATIANDPLNTKSALLGRMYIAMDKLLSESEWDKAVQAAEKIAKVQGWAGNEGNVNVFAGLTAKDIEIARERISGIIDSNRTESPKTELSN